MADETKQAANQDAVDEVPEELVKMVDGIKSELGEMKAQIAKATETVRDPRFNIRTGENILTSRPYSFTRLCKAIIDAGGQGAIDKTHRGGAKVEMELSAKLRKYHHHTDGSQDGRVVLVPLGTDLLPTADSKNEEGTEFEALPVELVKECRDLMRGELAYDTRELSRIAKDIGYAQLAKDMRTNDATQGGTLVALPEQGEVIDVLRNSMVFTRAGSRMITLPTQGSIRYPRMTADPTFNAIAEEGTITESTPTTGELTLSAKWYAAFVDLSPFLMKFSSQSVEAWLRMAFGRSAAIKLDRDMIDGQGGTSIKGVISYSGVSTIVATTVGSNGNTLEAIDPPIMLATLENSNAPVDSGVFFAMRPRLFNRVTHRRADAVSAADAAGAFLFDVARGQGGFPDRISGVPTYRSTNIPNTRAKGSGTNLTLMLGGVPSEWLVGMAGVMEIDMSNSDDVNFRKGIVTMRATQWADAGPWHEESFAFFDTLLENT